MKQEHQQRMQEAQEWIKSLSNDQLLRELSKAKALCQKHNLVGKKVELAILSQFKDKKMAAWKLAQAQLTEAYLYRKAHPSENV